MKARALIFAAAALMVILLVCIFVFGPHHPVALLRVVDAAGNGVSGVVITPEGLRTKPGPYVSGWYGWLPEKRGVRNTPVKTDAKGYARVPYPKYVFERIETGTLCLSVRHPDYVPDRPERRVSFGPPGGAPWRVIFDYILLRLRAKTVVARTDPIVLQKGVGLRLSAQPVPGITEDAPLYAQLSGHQATDADFWSRPAAGVLATRQLAAGPQKLRALRFDSKGGIWFSPVTDFNATTGQISEIVVELQTGVSVHGRIDDSVPRPVRNGRVIVHVWPLNEDPQKSPPEWHAWSQLTDDGSFHLSSLPPGKLEVVVLCDGFVSTNGPGQFPSMHYPQTNVLGTSDLDIVVGMEPTGCLEVDVRDDQGKPLKDAVVSCWPNVRYGEWSATVFGGDCYNTADRFLHPESKTNRSNQKWWQEGARRYESTTTVAGVAILLNLPCEADVFTVRHPKFELPAEAPPGITGQKRRQTRITLQPARTNHVSVTLEPTGQAPISHY